MRRSRVAIWLLPGVAACAPALRAPRSSPFPETPAESPMPPELRSAPVPGRTADFDALLGRGLVVPVSGVRPSQIVDSYDAPRDAGRRHEAIDIMAPRGTVVLAADDGVIARIGANALGGNVIWATDADRRFAYYYAHLDRYARGLHEGQAIERGDVIGYVGTTGNAPADTPHLHFQAMRIPEGKRFSDGPPFNPLPYFRMTGVTP